MKKWVLSALLLLLLVACGETGQVNEEQEPNAVDSHTQENEPTEDDKVDEEVPASTEEEPAEEEEPEEDKSDDQGENEDNTGTIDEEDGNSDTKEPQYIVNESNWTLEPIDALNSAINPNVVLLTIDDAPDRYALEMATILKEMKVKAIFFVNGHFLETEQERSTLKQIYDMGFPIGNHTMTHKSLRQLTEEEQYEEIVLLSDRVEEITGERPRFFRAPFGTNTDYAKELVKQEGMILMNWTYGYDWENDYMNAESLADIMVNTELLSSGSNLLMHDREWTKDALADIVKGLQEKNFEILDPDLIGTDEQASELE